jgi:hypothetical protein
MIFFTITIIIIVVFFTFTDMYVVACLFRTSNK